MLREMNSQCGRVSIKSQIVQNNTHCFLDSPHTRIRENRGEVILFFFCQQNYNDILDNVLTTLVPVCGVTICSQSKQFLKQKKGQITMGPLLSSTNHKNGGYASLFFFLFVCLNSGKMIEWCEECEKERRNYKLFRRVCTLLGSCQMLSPLSQKIA